MQSFAILYPAFVMAFLTFAVSVWLLMMRIKAYKAGAVEPKYFRLNQGEIPVYAKQAEQHYENLFEMPVLFYPPRRKTPSFRSGAIRRIGVADLFRGCAV